MPIVKKVIGCAAGILLSLLAACGEGNPLLGTWNVVSIKAPDLITQISIDRYKSLQPQKILFEEKEMGVVIQGEEKRVGVEYKKNSETVWAFCVNGKDWNEVIVQEPDTLIRKEKNQGGDEIVYTLKREKK